MTAKQAKAPERLTAAEVQSLMDALIAFRNRRWVKVEHRDDDDHTALLRCHVMLQGVRDSLIIAEWKRERGDETDGEGAGGAF